MSLPTTYKPSPLSIGSPRTSPFRRPESPSNRPSSPSSPSSHPTTPTTSPTKSSYQTSPSKLQHTSTPQPTSPTTPTHLTPSTHLPPPSPTPTTSSLSTTTTAIAVPLPSSQPRPAFQQSASSANIALSSLPPHLLSQLRTAFSILDRSSTGNISRSDVTATLNELGLSSTASEVGTFFPPGSPQTLPLAQFLSTLSGPLSRFSREEELMNAFAAFDERDSGEVDVGALRDSLCNLPGGGAMEAGEVEKVMEGFVGRRTFQKGGGQVERGDVFRYQEWVGGVLGTGGGEEVKAGVR